jgi:hypothetical protein
MVGMTKVKKLLNGKTYTVGGMIGGAVLLGWLAYAQKQLEAVPPLKAEFEAHMNSIPTLTKRIDDKIDAADANLRERVDQKTDEIKSVISVQNEGDERWRVLKMQFDEAMWNSQVEANKRIEKKLDDISQEIKRP